MAIKSEVLNGLKVALVHDKLTVPGGAEKVLAELHGLFPDAPIYTPLYQPEKFPEFAKANVITSSLNRFKYLRSHHQVTFPLLPYFTEQLDVSAYDVVISSSTSNAHGVLTRPDALHICYCHTPMRWAWTPYIDRRASSSLVRRLAAHYLRIWDSGAAQRVDAWFANSQTTASRIKKFYKKSATVIYPPTAVTKARVSHETDDFYLTVGRLIPGNYKRTDVLIDGALKANVRLKIVGTGPLIPELKKQAGNSKLIEFLGFVSDKERDDLYARCRAFLFAAEEDAGIVPIEAMAYGKPVIAFGRGGASETVIDGQTGVHFSEQTGDSLADAIKRCQSMTFDADAIHHHATKFSPDNFRHHFMEEVEKAVVAWRRTL